MIGLAPVINESTFPSTIVRQSLSHLDTTCYNDRVWFILLKGGAKKRNSLLGRLGRCGAVRGDTFKFYEVAEHIGMGSSANVYRVVKKKASASECPECAALKVMVPGTSASSVAAEAMYSVVLPEHPNIVRFRGVFCNTWEDGPRWSIMMDMCDADVYDHVQANGPYREVDGLKLFRGLFSALNLIHACDIIHRDVKSDNVLVGGDQQLKLSDFGMAVHMSELASVPRCESLGYTALEVMIHKPYGPPADVFSAGVTCFYALCGNLPFGAFDAAAVLKKIAANKVQFDRSFCMNVSAPMRNFISNLVQRQPLKRPSAAEAIDILTRNMALLELLDVSTDAVVADRSHRCGVGEDSYDCSLQTSIVPDVTGCADDRSLFTTKAPSDSDFGIWGTSSDAMATTSRLPESEFSPRAGGGEPLEKRPDGSWRRYRLRRLYATEGRRRPSHVDHPCHALAWRYQLGKQALDGALGAVAPPADFGTSFDDYLDRSVVHGGGELSLPPCYGPSDSALFSEQEHCIDQPRRKSSFSPRDMKRESIRGASMSSTSAGHALVDMKRESIRGASMSSTGAGHALVVDTLSPRRPFGPKGNRKSISFHANDDDTTMCTSTGLPAVTFTSCASFSM